MPSIKIPDRFRLGLSILSGLSNEAFAKVLTGFQTAPTQTRGQKELVSWLSSEMGDVRLPDVQKLVETLASLYLVRIRTGVKSEQLATDVAQSFRELDNTASTDVLRD
ncbi:MAG: hypothetical protein ACRDL7_07770, partial [Gaiellaceae bacterium]